MSAPANPKSESSRAQESDPAENGVEFDGTGILPVDLEHPAAYAVALAIAYVRQLPPGLHGRLALELNPDPAAHDLGQRE